MSIPIYTIARRQSAAPKPGEPGGPKPGAVEAKDPLGTIGYGDGSKFVPPDWFLFADGSAVQYPDPRFPAHAVPLVQAQSTAPPSDVPAPPPGDVGGEEIPPPPMDIPDTGYVPAPPGDLPAPVWAPPPGGGTTVPWMGSGPTSPLSGPMVQPPTTIPLAGGSAVAPEWVAILLRVVDELLTNVDLRNWLLSAIGVPGSRDMSAEDCWLMVEELPSWMRRPVARWRCGSMNPIGLSDQQQNLLLALAVASAPYTSLNSHPALQESGLPPTHTLPIQARAFSVRRNNRR